MVCIGTFVILARAFTSISVCCRHRVRVSGHQRRPQDGRAFDSHPVWVLDSTYAHRLWCNLRAGIGRCWLFECPRSGLLCCISGGRCHSSRLAIQHRRPRRTEQLLELVIFHVHNVVHLKIVKLSQRTSTAMASWDGLFGQVWCWIIRLVSGPPPRSDILISHNSGTTVYTHGLFILADTYTRSL